MEARRDLKLEHAMLSDVGRVRKGNEDACGADAKAGLFVVCDGMGGAAAGEIASHLAVETFLKEFGARKAAKRRTSPAQLLDDAVAAANKAVITKAKTSPDLRGMGTTLVSLLVQPSEEGHEAPFEVWTAHAGDSRCYRLRKGELHRLTEDHSLVEEQLRAGLITPEEAEFSPIRNVITRAVGSQSDLDTEVHCDDALPGDLYLLCSDGLTRDLSDSDLTRHLRAAGDDLELVCRSMIGEANVMGGADNITCLLVRIPL
jgi:protein phosphatase